jgi:hypothetical protein
MFFKPEMKAETARALVYILSNRNALTKACLYAPVNSNISDRLKRFYAACFAFWPEIKKKAGVREIFAYIRALERIVGADKLNGLQEYLAELILHDPHIKPDLSEEYRAQFLR